MINQISLLLFFTLSLWQCQPSANAEVSETNSQMSVTEYNEQLQANQVKPVKRDSIQPSRNLHRDRSRNKEQINTSFPFDIPLENIKKEVSTSDQLIPNNGKPTIVLFWLTTCYPCLLEMKAIKSKYEGWQKEEDFNIVAISTDWDKNFDSFVKKVNENQWPWEAYRDINREFRKILPGELNGLPQSFIFDKGGEIAYHSRKYRPGDEDKLFEKVKSLNK